MFTIIILISVFQISYQYKMIMTASIIQLECMYRSIMLPLSDIIMSRVPSDPKSLEFMDQKLQLILAFEPWTFKARPEGIMFSF